MKTSTTLLLALLAIGVFLGIRFYESKVPPTREAAFRERQVVIFDPEKVDGVDILTREEKIKFRKKGNVWELTEPVKDRANQEMVGEILGWTQMLQREETFRNPDKKELKRFGVAKPKLRLKFFGPGAPPELWFGKETAVEGRDYLRVKDADEVFVVNNALRNVITRKVDEFRDPRLTDLEARYVTRLAIRTGAGEIELEKDAGHWRLTKPLKARAHDEVVEELIGTLVGLPVLGFEAAKGENLNRFGLGEPAETIRLWKVDEEKPVTLAVGREVETPGADAAASLEPSAPSGTETPDGSPATPKESSPDAAPEKPRRYARISSRDVVCILPPAISRMLALRPNELRDRRLLRVEFDMVDRITLQAAGKPPLVLQRHLEDWTLRYGTGDRRAANRARVEALAKALQEREVSAFVADVAPDLSKYGLDEPSLTVTLSSYASGTTAESGAGELPIVKVRFGATEGDNVYAMVEGEPFIVAVPKTLVDSFRPEPVLWRSLSVLLLPQPSVVELQRKHGDEPPLVLRRKDGHWTSAKEGEMVEEINVESVLNTVAGLRAVRWEEGGLEEVEWELTFGTDTGETHRLRLSPPDAEGSRRAMLDVESGRFEISRPDAAALLLPLVGS